MARDLAIWRCAPIHRCDRTTAVNLYFLLDQAARRFPERGAVFLGARQIASFAELRSRVLRLSAGLRHGFGAGDRIAVISENRPEYVELFFGIWAAEMAAVPVNAKLHPKEMAQILGDSGAAAAFVSEKLAKPLREALDGSPDLGCRPIEIGGRDYSALLAEQWKGDLRSDPEALAWLFYTSGTTGRSKGAMLSHRNLMAMTTSHLADMESIDENCSLLHLAPMSHGSGLYIPPYVARGARQVAPESTGFDPAEFFDLCDVHPGCGAFFAPTMVQRVRLEAERTHRRPRNLRSIVYGGGPMYLEEIRKSLAVFGQVFAQIYGQGESPMTITGLRRADHQSANDMILGSVGYPRTGVEVAVLALNGERASPGEIGEIVCRGDVVMSGYWKNREATAQALRDGWLYTGDMGAFDDRGYLTLRDRSKDVIISGGSNIYPREVEEALLKHPDVAEACVVGQPDREWGEIVVAFVVAKDGAKLDEAALDALCGEHIARFKRPKRYVFLDEIPKSNYGKALKRELRRQFPPNEF
jgi:acyl-CoA synthetase (AMP-forming)/AMP-acid ligase II